MITVKIDEEYLLDLLMQRVEYWHKWNKLCALYEKYLKQLIYDGFFENVELDIKNTIDNMITTTRILTKKELDMEGIRPCNTLMVSDDGMLFLV